MKIIHTADWHIGKMLHKQDLYQDLCLFFEWFIGYLQSEKIDILLVSGDIFDLANPSNRDTKLYFDVLSKLSKINIRVIITGGNHDSITLLDAPSVLLDALNITVVGGAKLDLRDEIIPIYNANSEVECVILAVPFLRDKDLRQSMKASEDIARSDVISTAIKNHYDELVHLSLEKYGPKIPIIGMGHLYMSGSITSDSEREIHIGNLEGIDVELIHPNINYLALGHIHKPQRVGGKENIRYSGSPIFLDFSEREYQKMVIQISLSDHNITEIKPIEIPKNRSIVKLVGNLEDVKLKLHTFENPNLLPAFIELEVNEEQFDYLIIKALETLVSEQSSEKYIILKSRISFKDQKKVFTDGLITDQSINEMSPIQIFRNKMDEGSIDESQKEKLMDLYTEVLQELND